MSSDNYYTEDGAYYQQGNGSYYKPNSQFILVGGAIGGVSTDTYILPASMMSNGLDGQ